VEHWIFVVLLPITNEVLFGAAVGVAAVLAAAIAHYTMSCVFHLIPIIVFALIEIAGKTIKSWLNGTIAFLQLLLRVAQSARNLLP
jgi:hypothetical protein